MLEFFKKFDNLVQDKKLQDDNTKAFFSDIRRGLDLFFQKEKNVKQIPMLNKFLAQAEAALKQTTVSVDLIKKQAIEVYENLIGVQKPSDPVKKEKPSFFKNVKDNLLSAFSNLFKTVVNDKSGPADYQNIVKSVLGGFIGFLVDFFTGLAKTILPKSESATVDAAVPVLKQKLGSLIEAALPGLNVPADPAAPAPKAVIHSPLNQQAPAAVPPVSSASPAPRSPQIKLS